MRKLLEDLFPIYRTLCGPGALQTLQRIQRELPDLKIHEYPSGMDVCGWTIPKEFVVKESYVVGRSGERLIDFKQHPYSLWIYSWPLSQTVRKDEFLKHFVTNVDKIPLRQTYYKQDWGFCGDQATFDAIEADGGPFQVHIDVEHRDGFLRIGELLLPGESSQEILVNSYTCHPRGANDNCSGMVACVELFKRLAALPKRRYSYRLCLWPETIGPITWIANNPKITHEGVYNPFNPLICEIGRA